MCMLIPSWIQSTERINEATVAQRLREYHAAQREFRNLAILEGGAAGYCDNFRNLYYGHTARYRQLLLIDKAFADAFAGTSAGAPTAAGAPETSRPYRGYLFLEDPVMVKTGDWRKGFALIAYPVERGVRGGSNIFWINEKSVVFRQGVAWDSEVSAATLKSSPLDPETVWQWSLYETCAPQLKRTSPRKSTKYLAAVK